MATRGVPPEYAKADGQPDQSATGDRPLDALPEASERFRAVFDQGPIGIVLLRPDFSFMEVNDRFCAMLGYTREELLSLTADDVTHPDDLAFARDLALQLMTGAIPSYQIEKRYVRKDGEVVFAELSASVIRDDSGVPLHGVGMVTDITTRGVPPEYAKADGPPDQPATGDRPLDTLPEAAERFRAVFDQGPTGIAVVRADFSIIDVNERLCAMLAYSREELLALTVADVTHPDDFEFDRDLALQLMVGEIPSYRIEKRYVRKDGEVIWGEFSASLVRDAEGVVHYGVGMVTDITARKEVEEALRRSGERNAGRTPPAPPPAPEAEALRSPRAFEDADASARGIFGRVFTDYKLVWLGVALSVVFWFADALVDSLVFGKSSAPDQVISPEPYEIWIRSIVFVLLIGLGFYARHSGLHRRLTEQELRESEARWRSLTFHATDLIITLDTEGVIQWGNVSIPDGPLARALGTSAFEHVPEEHRESLREALRTVVETGETRTIEALGPGPDDSQSWYSSLLGPITVDGQVTGVTVVNRDITEQKQVAQKLEESEHEYRMLFELAADAILTGEPDGTVTDANVAATRLLGYTVEELRSITERDIIAPEVYAARHEDWTRQLAERGSFRGDSVWVRKDGTRVPVSVSGKGVDLQGKVKIQLFARDVTERIQAAQKLQKSEREYRTLFELAADAILTADPDGTVTDANVAATQLLGYTVEELTSMTERDIVAPEVYESVHEDSARQGEKRGYFNVETVWVRKDGSRVPVSVSGKAVDLQGNMKIQIFARDVSERDQAAQKLQESEERYRALYTRTPAMLHSVGEDGRVVAVNDRWLRRLGYERDEVLGRKPTDFLTEESRSWVGPVNLPNFWHAGTAEELPLQFLTKQGEVVEVLLTAIVEHDDDGNVVGKMAVINDVTARKQAEQALRQSEEHFRLLADNSLDLIVGSTLDGQMSYASPNSADIVGYTQEELARMTALDLLHPDEVDAIDEETTTAITEGRVAQYVHRLKVKGGEWLWFEGLGKPVVTPSGETRMLISYRDISERRRAADELRESEQRYRALYSRTPAMLHSLDVEGRIVAVNNCWLRTLGYGRDEVLGRKSTDFQTEESRVVSETVLLPRFWQEGAAQEVPLQFLTKQGGVVEVLLSGIVEHDVGGNVVEMLAVLNDVTERMDLEAALVSAREELEGKVERQMLRRNPYNLTFRELTVLHLVAAGRSDKEIAAELVISRLTAQKHVSNILGKMDASSRTEAATRALREGLLD